MVHWSHHSLKRGNCLRVAMNRISNLSAVVFEPRLGKLIVERNRQCSNDGFIIKETKVPMQIGAWKFHTANIGAEFEPGTNNTYFAIRRKYIHQDVLDWSERSEEDRFRYYNPDELFFGQFHSFIHMELPEWNEGDKLHSIGRCTLWQPILALHLSGKPIINIQETHIHRKNNTAYHVKTEYIMLNRVETAAALIPVMEDDHVTPRKDHYIAIALRV